MGTRAVMALTRLEVVDADVRLADDAGRETVADALGELAQQREDRLYDHLMRMGRLSARERVLHLLLELYERLEKVGLVRGDTFKIPLTQEVFADALGLSVVHINRTLKQLRQEGAVTFKAGSVFLKDRERLSALAHYSPQFDGDERRSFRDLDSRAGTAARNARALV
jgi:CRP-like cAMP-binding protein